MRKCCALRATMILISFYSVLAGLRPARMHRENSGRSGGIGASARSDRAKSGVFRDRSASAGVVTRYFSLCLIFWCFWIKPKAQKKKCTTEEIDSYFGKYPLTFDSVFPARSGFTTFCHQKVAPKVSAGRKSRGTADGLRLKRYADELAPAFSTAHPPPVLLPAFSQCGVCCALRATMILISFT